MIVHKVDRYFIQGMYIITRATITIFLNNIYTISMHKTIILSINHCQFYSRALHSTINHGMYVGFGRVDDQ